jgi:hypothetical protein
MRWERDLMASARVECSASVPWDRLSRATFIPERISLSSMTVEALAGPMVQTILVRLLKSKTGLRFTAHTSEMT